MPNLFDDEILSVVLDFANPKKKEMADADKIASRLSLALDSIIRRSIGAGKAVNEIFESLQQLEPALKKLEERTAKIGGAARTVQTAGAILQRYTPDRIEAMIESRAQKVAETSGTAALRRELSANNQLFQRLLATQQGTYNRATGNSPIGRALFLDTETTGLNPLKHQIVELQATLVEYRKTTGEILNVVRSYSGLQDLRNDFRADRFRSSKEIALLPQSVARAVMDRSERIAGGFREKGTLLPVGMTREDLRGQSLSVSQINNLIKSADVLVAHNVKHDKAFLERVTPMAASVPWLDTMRGVPWKTLGYSSRAQQDLLRAFNINPGTAHRAGSDVDALIKLMNSTSPLGGSRLFSMLLGNQGPLNESQKTLAVIQQVAEELKSGFQERLGVGRRYDPVSVRYRPEEKYLASQGAGDVSEFFSRYVISSIEGELTARSRKPARSNDYGTKYGSGYSQESTPGMLSAAGGDALRSPSYTLEKRIAAIDEFLRNAQIMSGSASSTEFVDIYNRQAKYQEGLQRSMGRGRQLKGETRLGQDLALATMSGVNTHLFNVREGVSQEDSFLAELLQQSIDHARYGNLRTMLEQPWAKPTRNFESSEIDRFINERRNSPSVSSIQTAAQMAHQLGPNDPRYLALGSILTQGQVAGRKQAAIRAAEREEQLIKKLSAKTSAGGGSRFARLLQQSAGDLKDIGLSAGMAGFAPFMSAGGIGFGSFSQFLKFFRSRRAASQESIEVPLSSADIRASMRQDSLDSRLRRLAEAAGAATKAFENFRDVAAPAKKQYAQQLLDSRILSSEQAYSTATASIDRTEAKLRAQKNRVGKTADRRVFDIGAAYEQRSAELGLSALDAEYNLERARESKSSMEARLRRSKKRMTDAEIEARTAPILQRAQARAIKAQYAYSASQLTNPGDIEQLRAETANRLALSRYGLSNDASIVKKRNEYAARVQELFGTSSTLGQTTQIKYKRVVEDRNEREGQLDAQIGALQEKRTAAEAAAFKKRTDAYAKYRSTVDKIDTDVEQRGAKAAAKRVDAERRGSEAIIASRKREAAILAGRGGSGGGGTGGRIAGGGHGEGEFGSRGGLDFGLGLAGLVAYTAAFKELLKDTVIYAARTETLQLVTDQMSKVNGLNAQSVRDEVKAVQDLNITTQEANTTVQKMMFAQLDVAKATNLARTAQDAAILANVNSSEALDRIILGIVTGQTRVLHNMNLQVSMLQVMRELRADKRAKGESGDPTELEKRQGMLNKVLLEGAKILGTYERSMLTAGKQFNSLQREVQEAQNAIGQEFLPEFGRFVSLTTRGLHFVQENGDAFAKIASAITSIGTAASAVGTISFIRWMMSTPAIPPWVKAVGAAVGGATYLALNQDNAQALTQTAMEQREALLNKQNKVLDDRKRLWAARDENSDDWKNAWERNAAELKSSADAQTAINEELTRKLAEEYNKRIADLDKYINDAKGKNGLFRLVLADTWHSPENSFLGNLARAIPFFGEDRGDAIVEAEQHKKELSKRFSTVGVSSEDIEREAAFQRAQAQRLAILPPSMLNKQKLETQALIAGMTAAEGKLLELDERLSESGSIGLRARKSMGSPREKILLDYEQQISQVDELVGKIKGLRNLSKAGDVDSKVKLESLAKELGGGSFTSGQAKIDEFLDRAGAVEAAAREDRDIQLGKLTRQNRAQLLQVNAQLPLAQVQADVVQGNYDSEVQAAEKVFQIKQDLALKTKKLIGDVDEYDRQVAQNKSERDLALLEIDTRRTKAIQQRKVEIILENAAFDSRRLLAGPGTKRSVSGSTPLGPDRASFQNLRASLVEAYENERRATFAITDEQERLNAQLHLTLRLREDLFKVEQEEQQTIAQSRIEEFESNLQLRSEVDRIINAKGRSNEQRNLDEIDRTRDAQIAIANNLFNELQPTTPADKQAGLTAERDSAVRKANSDRDLARVKELDQQVESARSRLADVFDKRFQKMERINELMANSAAEEASAAFNTHRLRLEYIEKEYEARGKTIEAEKIRNEQIQEAEFDHLQKLLELRRKEIEGVRDAAGRVFDSLTTKGSGGIAELISGQLKVTGRQIFQNIAVEYFSGSRKVLGGLIPGQETVDANGNRKPTALGRILSGTIFSPSHTEDINKLLANVTQENTSAEKDLTEAIKALDADIRRINGLPAAATGNPRKTIPTPPSVYSNTPLWGGIDSTNPLIFHAMPGSSNFQGASNLLKSNTDAEVDNTRALRTLTDTLKRQKSASTTGTNSVGSVFSTLSQVPGILMSQDRSGTSNPAVFSGFPGGGTNSTGGLGGIGGVFNPNTKAGKIAGGVAVAAGGTLQAIAGFKQGGARGVSSGIGGTLIAASAIPGPQSPFLLAGGLVLSALSGMLPDPKAQRQKEIDRYMRGSKYIDPLAISREMTLSGNLLGYNKYGVARDTGTGAFPIQVQPNQERITYDSIGSQDPSTVFLPGRVLDTVNPPAAQSVTYQINLPIHAMDSKDVIARSKDIAAAVSKELKLSGDLSVSMQNAMFGTM